MPRLRLPLWLVYYAALLIELTHAALWRVHNFQPLLTRCEVYKTGARPCSRLCKACPAPCGPRAAALCCCSTSTPLRPSCRGGALFLHGQGAAGAGVLPQEAGV